MGFKEQSLIKAAKNVKNAVPDLVCYDRPKALYSCHSSLTNKIIPACHNAVSRDIFIALTWEFSPGSSSFNVMLESVFFG